MKKLKCLIVDDEKLAGELIQAYVEKIPELEVAGLCQSALTAQAYLSSGEVEVLFLDIRMPELNGIEFLKGMHEKPFTVLITAYSEFALQGFELDVVDYLLKPVEFDRFYQAVQKVLVLAGHKQAGRFDPFEGEISAPDYIFIKADNRIYRVELGDILFVESMREYVMIHTDKKRYLTRFSLSRLEEILPAETFMRIHRTHIVNLAKVDHIEGNHIRLGAHSLSISKAKREEVHNWVARKGLW